LILARLVACAVHQQCREGRVWRAGDALHDMWAALQAALPSPCPWRRPCACVPATCTPASYACVRHAAAAAWRGAGAGTRLIEAAHALAPHVHARGHTFGAARRALPTAQAHCAPACCMHPHPPTHAPTHPPTCCMAVAACVSWSGGTHAPARSPSSSAARLVPAAAAPAASFSTDFSPGGRRGGGRSAPAFMWVKGGGRAWGDPQGKGGVGGACRWQPGGRRPRPASRPSSRMDGAGGNVRE
jgi:hypothetical protein